MLRPARRLEEPLHVAPPVGVDLVEDHALKRRAMGVVGLLACCAHTLQIGGLWVTALAACVQTEQGAEERKTSIYPLKNSRIGGTALRYVGIALSPLSTRNWPLVNGKVGKFFKISSPSEIMAVLREGAASRR